MGKLDTVYSNQIFIRVNAKDNTDKRDNYLIEYGAAGKAMELIKRDMNKSLINGKPIDDQTIQEYSDARATLYRLRKEVNSNGIDKEFVPFFWTLNNTCYGSEATLYGTNNQMVLTTITGVTSRAYNSLNEISEEYISLDEVLSKGRFHGREMSAPFDTVYLMYSYGNLGILYFRGNNGENYIIPSIMTGEIPLYGDVIESMRDPNKIKKKVYKMQQEFKGQID